MTGRASGGPLLEADLCGSSRACETREGREAEIREKVERWFKVEERILSDKVGNVRRSGDGRWDGTVGAPGLLVGRFLDLSADRVVGGWDCVLSRSGSVPPAGSILHAAQTVRYGCQVD